ncbi:nucleolar complex-associated protein 3 [Sarocladium strictum]
MATASAKRRKTAHGAAAVEDPEASSRQTQKSFFKNASNWNLEQDYESRPRKGKKKEKESNRLPIKTRDGRIEQLQGLQEDAESVESDTEWLEGREDDAESWDGVDDDVEAQVEEQAEPEIPVQQQIVEAQEELAKLAMAVNENPEDHVGAFKSLAKIGTDSKVPQVQMLALMTQMTVYKDVIPGYRIRPAEDMAKEQLTKEVRQLRQYEQALISGYHNYIKELTRCAKLPSTRGAPNIALVAVQCACTLITSVPHFNFRDLLLRILVGRLSRRYIDEAGRKSLEALEELCREDDEGRPSMEAVSLLAKMMKAKDYYVHESVLNLFLSLRVLTEFSGKASHDAVDRPPKQKKKQREFRTKRERKAMKEQKALDRDLANADAVASHEERDRMQSDTLKLVFATYFRILKMRVPHLMGAVLEGLAKYAHLINQDFFGDLLEALKDLIRYSTEDAEREFDAGDDEEMDEDAGNSSEEEDGEQGDNDVEQTRNLSREALLCIVTAFALLAGQDVHNSRSELHLDLSHFITHLFQTLLPLSVNPNLELTRLPNTPASSTSKINVHTTTVLLLRSLTGVLLPPYNVRSVPPLRLAAFTKQLMTVALQLPEKSCQGVLALLGDVAHTHGTKVRSLWDTEERKGDGKYNPVGDSVEGTNPFTATVWEGELLRKHFSPKVRESAKALEKSMSGAGAK